MSTTKSRLRSLKKRISEPDHFIIERVCDLTNTTYIDEVIVVYEYNNELNHSFHREEGEAEDAFLRRAGVTR